MSDAKCSKTGYGGPSLGEAPRLARQRLCKAIDDLRHAVCRAVFLIALLPTAATASADPDFPLARRYCTTCHGLEPLIYQRHTIAGWWLEVQRMRWINGAAAPGEAVLPLGGNWRQPTRPPAPRRCRNTLRWPCRPWS